MHSFQSVSVMKSGFLKKHYPFVVVGAYLLFGVLWIYYSDQMVMMLFNNPVEPTLFEVEKGWAFLVLTTLLLSSLLYRHTTRLNAVITEKKITEEQLAESDAQFRAMVENMPVGIFLLNPQGKLVFCNKKAETLIGYPLEEILGIRWLRIISRNERHKIIDLLRHLISDNQAATFETQIVRPDKSVRWCQISTAPTVSESRLFGHVGMIFDLNRIAEELKYSNERLNEVDRSKSLFIASASHELRSPLNAIIGFSSILLRSISGSLNEKQEAQTSSILRSGKYLLTLINNIMDVSQVETGRMACSNEEFLVGDVINEVLDISREPISQKNLDLTVDVPDIVMFSDRQRLIQCLHNLVNNAIKYTEEGAIAIRARTFDEGDGKSLVEIVVEDTGIGIAEEDIPDIFTPFSRIDSHLKGDVEGAGLGLFLVHKLVTEMLGGRIDVESKPEEGSRFSLLLPRWNSDDCSTPADLQSEVPN